VLEWRTKWRERDAWEEKEEPSPLPFFRAPWTTCKRVVTPPQPFIFHATGDSGNPRTTTILRPNRLLPPPMLYVYLSIEVKRDWSDIALVLIFTMHIHALREYNKFDFLFKKMMDTGHVLFYACGKLI
jgi:hypothetical protein